MIERLFLTPARLDALLSSARLLGGDMYGRSLIQLIDISEL